MTAFLLGLAVGFLLATAAVAALAWRAAPRADAEERGHANGLRGAAAAACVYCRAAGLEGDARDAVEALADACDLTASEVDHNRVDAAASAGDLDALCRARGVSLDAITPRLPAAHESDLDAR